MRNDELITIDGEDWVDPRPPIPPEVIRRAYATGQLETRTWHEDEQPNQQP